MVTEFFDTHAHYDDNGFDADRDELIASLSDAGVLFVIDPGCDLESSRAAASLAKRYPFFYYAAGFHPEELSKFNEDDYSALCSLARGEKCVAVGEIGLDYYWDDTHKDEQKTLFRRQIELALSLDKPVIVHDREAHGDSFEIVSDYKELRGVFHCYSGSVEMAQELLRRGWYLGFDGPITYKNARKALEVLEICPVDRILIETDSPYLSPVPMRGKRNDSRNLRFIVEKIAQIKGMTPDDVASAALENGKRLFSIK